MSRIWRPGDRLAASLPLAKEFLPKIHLWLRNLELVWGSNLMFGVPPWVWVTPTLDLIFQVPPWFWVIPKPDLVFQVSHWVWVTPTFDPVFQVSPWMGVTATPDLMFQVPQWVWVIRTLKISCFRCHHEFKYPPPLISCFRCHHESSPGHTSRGGCDGCLPRLHIRWRPETFAFHWLRDFWCEYSPYQLLTVSKFK